MYGHANDTNTTDYIKPNKLTQFVISVNLNPKDNCKRQSMQSISDPR